MIYKNIIKTNLIYILTTLIKNALTNQVGIPTIHFHKKKFNYIYF